MAIFGGCGVLSLEVPKPKGIAPFRTNAGFPDHGHMDPLEILVG
jgi:hypothetical protein